jgi:PAS domain S-box-containing protein
MTAFRDLPIRRKVALVVILTSGIVLFLTSAAFMTFEWVTFRSATLTVVSTLGRVIADNSTAALRFRNEAELTQLIATLRADPEIVTAAIYDERGQRLAAYHRLKAPDGTLGPVPPQGHAFGGGRLAVYLPITHDDRQLGTLLIESSLAGMQRRFLLYGGIVLLILVTSSAVAFVISSRLQERITEPIQELAKTAHAITTGGDYSTRAWRYGNDELGALTDAFNRMLDEIKERDRRLSASEERLRVALASAAMGTWRYYPHRNESIIDENFREIFGLPAGENVASMSVLLECVYPEDRERLQTELRRALQDSDAPYSVEYRVLGRNRAMRWVRDRGRVVRRPDGAINYVTGALVDITERKQAEHEIHRLNADLERRVAQRTAELEQANRELEAFTYSVSHDLRSPLRHMADYAEIVDEDADSRLSEESKTCVARIRHAAARLSGLVDSLLNLSRIGRQPLQLQLTPLDEILGSALREFDGETQQRRIQWQRQPLPVVNCDPKLMHIVFVNLLSNALKYTRPRDVAVIAIGAQTQDGRATVFVRDNGVGYDPRFQHKLFGVFERLHDAARFEGTGVGLATVDRIIRRHGGRIWGQGDVDRGTTFSFTLPGM